jgi:hypothetical protein
VIEFLSYAMLATGALAWIVLVLAAVSYRPHVKPRPHKKRGAAKRPH